LLGGTGAQDRDRSNVAPPWRTTEPRTARLRMRQ
jgi:hypothetical protein